MNQPTPNIVPFTEDPTKEYLTEYAKFIKSAYTPMFCEHKVTDSKMHVAGDGVNTKGNRISLTSEKKEEGEGSIYQKDMYTFCQNHLGKEDDLGNESQHRREESPSRREESPNHREEDPNRRKESSNRRGYWLIEVADHPQETTLPLPVFQFGTLGLEVYPADKGVIESVHRAAKLSHPLTVANFGLYQARDLGRRAHAENMHRVQRWQEDHAKA